MKNSLIILIFCLWIYPCFSQEYVFKPRRLEVSKDALANYIAEMARDEHGNLWLATRNGIHRFDGKTFDNFQGVGRDMRLDKKQFNCAYYRDNKFYAGTQRGVSVFNTVSCNYEAFDDSSNLGVVVKDIYCSPSGWVYWINEFGSLIAKEGKGRGIKKTKLEGGYYNPRISGLEKDIYCLSDTVFYVINAEDLQVKERIPIPVRSITARFVSVDKGKVLFIKGNSLFSYETLSRQLKVIRTFKNEITDITITPNGVFTIENGNTVYYYDSLQASGNGVKIDLLFNAPLYLSGFLYLKGQLLIKTSNGLFIIDINPRYFRTFFQTYDSIGKFYYDPRGISQSGDNLFLFSFQRIYSRNAKTGLFSRVLSGQKIGAHSVYTEQDTIWIGSEGGGLIKLNPKKLAWESYDIDPRQSKSGAGIPALCPWGKDRFLLGTYSGLCEYRRGEKNIRLLELELPEWKNSRPFVEGVAALSDGGCILATNKGTYRIDKDLKLLVSYSPNDGNSLSGQGHALLVTANNKVWVGTSNGLFLYELDGSLIRHITTSTGLAGDRIASLIQDRSGNLWVGTFSGLSCIQSSSGKIFNFHIDEGITDNEFNHASASLLKSGEILMGTTKGFVIFDPEKCLQKPKIDSRVRISKIEYGTANGIEVIYDPEEMNKEFVLLGRDINFAKMYLRCGEEKYLDNVSFDYQIVGVHANWQAVRSDNFIQLVNLRPGHYKMKVRMLVEGSIIENSTRVFDLHAREYFYNTQWFYLSIAGIIFLLILFYLRLLLIRERKFRELRLLLSQNLHDEVGSYLTGISMNLDMIKKKPESLGQYQQSISDLSRKALGALKDGLWSLDRDTDNGQHFWDRVKVLAKENFEPLDINYSINAPSGLSAMRLGIIQKNQLIYVIKECFTNAIKYGGGNSVSVNWELTGGRHRIIIKNRKSDDKARTGGMMGLDNIRFRMEKMGGKMLLEETAQDFSVILMIDFIK